MAGIAELEGEAGEGRQLQAAPSSSAWRLRRSVSRCSASRRTAMETRGAPLTDSAVRAVRVGVPAPSSARVSPLSVSSCSWGRPAANSAPSEMHSNRSASSLTLRSRGKRRSAGRNLRQNSHQREGRRVGMLSNSHGP